MTASDPMTSAAECTASAINAWLPATTPMTALRAVRSTFITALAQAANWACRSACVFVFNRFPPVCFVETLTVVKNGPRRPFSCQIDSTGRRKRPQRSATFYYKGHILCRLCSLLLFLHGTSPPGYPQWARNEDGTISTTD